MKRRVPAAELTLEDLPEPTDARAVFVFAMGFDGYAHFGSFEAAADNASRQPRATLADLRNELFMCARASRHSDADVLQARYADLLPLFKAALSGG